MIVGRAAPSIGLVIDLPGNAGVSATNGFEAYADAALNLFSMNSAFSDNRFPWFELDSLNLVNLVVPSGGHAAAFSPVIEPGYQANSIEALRARLSRMRVPEDEVEVAVSAMLAATRGAFGP